MSSLGRTTQRLVKKIDFSVNAINPIAGNVPEAAQIPLPPGNDRQAIEVALQDSDFPDVEGGDDIQQAERMVVKNIMERRCVRPSPCLAKAINDPQRAKVVGPPPEFLWIRRAFSPWFLNEPPGQSGNSRPGKGKKLHGTV